MNLFYQQVYDIVAQVPPGRVVSYGQIARMLGRPRAAREVGRAMRICPDGLPWQRVVMQDGAIAGGGFAGLRLAMLEAEGVRDKLVLVVGGPRISHELAKELGYDAGFGPNTYAEDVASFVVQEMKRRERR